MLELKVLDGDREVLLKFEHSLLSLSKWESKHLIPFMSTHAKTSEQMMDYFQAMLLNPEVGLELVYRLSPEQMDQLTTYISAPMTASSVPQEGPKRPSMEVVTSELVYYWMTELKINWEAQYWHYNRLMMLIAITTYKRQPQKKRNPADMYKQWKELNARNKERFGTTG